MARADDLPVSTTNLDGLQLISDGQVIPFVNYIRHVLPLDGYVFWLRTAGTTVRGSVHVTMDKRQNEDETVAVNRVVFTTGQEVQEFNVVEPDHMWVGEVAGVRFAFSRAGPRYKASGLFHYVGTALYPALESQLVDVGEQLSDRELVVSNSLPAWLQLKSYHSPLLNARNPCVTLYPSFLVPDNLRPPYGAVHIAPELTQAIQDFPALDRIHATQHQLASDKVRITLYGLTNDQVMDFSQVVMQFSLDTDIIGLMNMPIVSDAKRTQAELGILAMKKTITYDVSYYQFRLRHTARALIKHASATILQPTEP